MWNGTWQMEKQRGFAILHLRFAIQDAFFSILLIRLCQIHDFIGKHATDRF